jgi:glutathione synthase/RimK-type ligase-like ATP-grasp enzyme
VVKPASGASGYSVELVERDAAAAAVGKLAAEAHATGIVVQEFLPQIAEGELSLVYFNGVHSHAVRKIPAAGEFRVNSRFNAIRRADKPDTAIVADGMAALRSLPEMPLYARVDGVVRENRLVVIELELIEPALFLDFDPPSAERFAEATIARLGV